MSPEEKFLAGPRLFDQECRIMMDAIRDEFPEADKQRVREILKQRINLLRDLEESQSGLYVTFHVVDAPLPGC